MAVAHDILPFRGLRGIEHHDPARAVLGIDRVAHSIEIDPGSAGHASTNRIPLAIGRWGCRGHADGAKQMQSRMATTMIP